MLNHDIDVKSPLRKGLLLAGILGIFLSFQMTVYAASTDQGTLNVPADQTAQEGAASDVQNVAAVDPLTEAWTVYYPTYDTSAYVYGDAFAAQASTWQMTYQNGFIVNYQNIFPDQGLDAAQADDQTILQAILNILPVGLSYYDTGDGVVGFRCTGGAYLKFYKDGYTDDVNYAAEAAYILDLIRTNRTESSRMPIYLCSMADTMNTYVEVSLDAQHCWLYQNGVVTGESDIVTGTKGKTDTPQGFYNIVLLVNGKILKGDDYECWVDKWMRFTPDGNYGLHDASWRGKFGGTIYEKNGSHGCVNLPKKFAYQVYDAAYVGMPVVIY